jgi:hypothetical protein
MPNSEVQLEAAFVWTCEGCGRTNYGRFITVELDEDQKQIIQDAISDILDIDVEPKTGDWVSLPKRVRCKRCKTIYDTIPIGGIDLGEDDDDDE